MFEWLQSESEVQHEGLTRLLSERFIFPRVVVALTAPPGVLGFCRRCTSTPNCDQASQSHLYTYLCDVGVISEQKFELSKLRSANYVNNLQINVFYVTKTSEFCFTSPSTPAINLHNMQLLCNLSLAFHFFFFSYHRLQSLNKVRKKKKLEINFSCRTCRSLQGF